VALIDCPDCQSQISKHAPTCPHCGRPMAAFSSKAVQVQRKGGKFEFIGFLSILAGMGLCYMSVVLGGIVISVGFVVFLIGRFM
jgi:predicted amidophosphoribosyltransferase